MSSRRLQWFDNCVRLLSLGHAGEVPLCATFQQAQGPSCQLWALRATRSYGLFMPNFEPFVQPDPQCPLCELVTSRSVLERRLGAVALS